MCLVMGEKEIKTQQKAHMKRKINERETKSTAKGKCGRDNNNRGEKSRVMRCILFAEKLQASSFACVC